MARGSLISTWLTRLETDCDFDIDGWRIGPTGFQMFRSRSVASNGVFETFECNCELKEGSLERFTTV